MQFEEFMNWYGNTKDTRLSKIPTSVLIFLQERFQLYREGNVDPMVEVACFIYYGRKRKYPNESQCTDFMAQLGIFSTIEKLRRGGFVEADNDFDLFKLQDKNKLFHAVVLQKLQNIFQKT